MICWECKKEIKENARQENKYYRGGSFISLPKKKGRWYCQECWNQHNQLLDAERKEYGRLKKRLMFERAISAIEDNLDIYEYQEAIADMAEYVEEHPDKFDSSQEMIAAMMLAANGIHVKMQYKVNRYRVDLFIPELCIALEVDGDRHNGAKAEIRDSKRDTEIRKVLGEEWEIIRVPTELIEQNPERLLEAIIKAKQERQRLRAKNNGELPYNYSRVDS